MQDEEMVVAALLHDIGDDLSSNVNHSEYAASVLKTLCFRKNTLDHSSSW